MDKHIRKLDADLAKFESEMKVCFFFEIIGTYLIFYVIILEIIDTYLILNVIF